jgi:hypothetical protein
MPPNTIVQRRDQVALLSQNSSMGVIAIMSALGQWLGRMRLEFLLD